VAACKPEVVAGLLHQLGDITDPAYAQEVAYCRDALTRNAPQVGGKGGDGGELGRRG
jgi:hypothetical protein